MLSGLILLQTTEKMLARIKDISRQLLQKFFDIPSLRAGRNILEYQGDVDEFQEFA
jgi:hypothetical protein